MVQLAIAGEPRFALDMHEIERGGVTYTIDTLHALRSSQPNRPLVLIMGSDQFARFDTWRDWQQIVRNAHIAVAQRAGAPSPPNPALANGAGRTRRRSRASRLASRRQRGRIRDDAGRCVGHRGSALARAIPQPHERSSAWPRWSLPQCSTIFDGTIFTRPKLDLRKLQRVVVDALEDVKAHDIKIFNTSELSDMFERVVVASGTSNRQTRALASSVVEKVKEAGGDIVSVEGEDTGEWVLVDCNEVIVHIMQPAYRAYYNLEELWGGKPVRLKSPAEKTKRSSSKSKTAGTA